jgi:hypothetical protein
MHGSGGGAVADDDDDRRPALENTLVRRTHLPDHLVWQLRLSDLSEVEKELGALIIGSLNAEGYLTLSVEELAFLANVWPHTEELERVLRRIQDLDPPGVAARDLPECLCIQLRQLGLPEDSLPARIVRDHIPLLESRRFDKLAKELGVSLDEIAAATKVISVVEPTSGREYGEGEARYVIPHSTNLRSATSTSSRSTRDGAAPRPPFYRQMLGYKRPPEARLHPGEDAAAAWLIKSRPPAAAHALHGHHEHREVPARLLITACRSLSAGAEGVANDTACTIHGRRATAGKRTRRRAVELGYFFTSLRSGHGGGVGREKERIRPSCQGRRTETVERPVHRRTPLQ